MMGTMSPRPVALVLSSALLVLVACDDKPSSGGGAAAKPSASAAPSVPPPAAASDTAPAATPLSIVVDDKRLTVNSDKVEFASPNANGLVTGALSKRPGVEGAVVDVVVMRDTLTPKVAMVIGALRAANARGATVKSQRRDGSTAALALTWGNARPECAAVGMIGKDNAIAAWSVGGGTATRFAKGFAGPDLTLGSAGIRKLEEACDASVFYISAAENITWGLTFDLALAVRGGGDAGAPSRATTTTLLVEPPVPGRKVAQD
jgi:hypothetical protein